MEYTDINLFFEDEDTSVMDNYQQRKNRKIQQRKALVKEKRARGKISPSWGWFGQSGNKFLKKQVHKANRVNFNVGKALDGQYENFIHRNGGSYKKIAGQSFSDWMWITT